MGQFRLGIGSLCCLSSVLFDPVSLLPVSPLMGVREQDLLSYDNDRNRPAL